MSSPINSRRFGLYPLASNRGLLPVDPPRLGRVSIKFLGSMSLATGQYRKVSGFPVGPADPNKILVIVPSAFYNSGLNHDFDFVRVNGRDAAIIRGTHSVGGQAVFTGICHVPFADSKDRVDIEINSSDASISQVAMAVFSVICSNPKPFSLRVSGSTAISLQLRRGAVGVFCTASGEPQTLGSVENGVVDYNNTGTGRITATGRIIDPRKPLVVASNTQGDSFAVTGASWS